LEELPEEAPEDLPDRRQGGRYEWFPPVVNGVFAEDQMNPTFVTLRNLVPAGPPTSKVYKKLADRKDPCELRLWYVVRPTAPTGPGVPIGPGVAPGVYNIFAFRRSVDGKELPVLNAMRRAIARGVMPPIVLYATVDSALNHLAAEYASADRAGAPLKEVTNPLSVYVE
jgi:hypothetical protein